MSSSNLLKRLIIIASILFSVNAYGEEIIGAFGYALGTPLAPEDILVRRGVNGPHDVIAKEKTRTVKKVQAYTTADNLIYAIDGINTFNTMDSCNRMVLMINHYLSKKYASVIDRKNTVGNGINQIGVLLEDKMDNKSIMIICSAESTRSVLSLKYADMTLTSQVLEKESQDKEEINL